MPVNKSCQARAKIAYDSVKFYNSTESDSNRISTRNRMSGNTNSCRLLFFLKWRVLAELRSTLTNHMSMPGVWCMSVVVPKAEVHEILI